MNTMLSSLTLGAVRDLVRPVAPVVSVYLGLAPAYPSLDQLEDLDLRWRRLATDLSARHADPATRGAVTEHLAALGPRPTELAVFAAHGRVLLAQPIPGGPTFDRAYFGAPAAVIPLLGWLQQHPAYVVVVTDRTGADLTAVPQGAYHGSTTLVVGPDDEIERNAPGGWAQPRYQRRAEDSWRHNARAVAQAATHALRDVDAGLLLVAGDVRAVQLLREDLAPLTRHGLTVQHLPGGRAPDGSDAGRFAAIASAVDAYATRQSTAMLAALTRHSSRHGTATYSAAPTLAALAAGRVRTLFVADRAGDERTCSFGVAVRQATELRHPATADTWPARGRLVDVAVRAALLTNAEVRVIEPGTVTGDIAALCRYPLG
jgi:hypothetical protein